MHQYYFPQIQPYLIFLGIFVVTSLGFGIILASPLIKSKWLSHNKDYATENLTHNLSTTFVDLKKWKREIFGEADYHIKQF